MNNSYFFIALLLCIALALTFFFPVVGLANDDSSVYNNGYDGVIILEDYHAKELESGVVVQEVLEECNERKIRGLLDLARLLQLKGLWGNRSLSQSPTEKIFGASSFVDASLWSYSKGKTCLSSLRQQRLRKSESFVHGIISRQQQRYEKQGAFSSWRKALGFEVDNKESKRDAYALFQGRNYNGEISEGIWSGIRNSARSDTENNLEDCWIESAWIKCDNGVLFDGYWGFDGIWVPGFITKQTQFTPAPPHISGYAVYYAQGVMEATAKFMGYDLTNYLDGVAMMSCADIGQVIWIRREGEKFEGPYLAVDCAQHDDFWSIVVNRDEVVEVGWRTAIRWGFVDQWRTPVEVVKSRYRPIEDIGDPIDYDEWFLETARFYPQSRTRLPPRYYFKQPGIWYAGGRSWSYLQFNINSLYVEPWICDLIYRIGD